MGVDKSCVSAIRIRIRLNRGLKVAGLEHRYRGAVQPDLAPGLTVLVDVVIVSVVVWIFVGLRLPERLDIFTVSVPRGDRVGIPQVGLYLFPIVAGVLGIAAVVASFIAPYPALHGPALLLTTPLWQVRLRRSKVSFVVPIGRGLELAVTVLYVLGSFATLVGIVRLGPA